MKLVFAVVGCVFLFLIALVVTVPARFALQFVPLPPAVQIGGVEGTLWRGEADTVLVDGTMLRNLNWQVQPLSLLTGRVVADIELGEHVDNLLIGSGRVRASRNELEVANLQLEARLVDLAAFAPQPSPFPLRGDVVLNMTTFVLGQPLCAQANGQVELVGGAMQVGQAWENLGALEATIGCDSGYLTAELVEPNTVGLRASMRASMNSAEGEFQILQSAEAPRSIRNLVSVLPQQARQRQRFSVRF